MSVVISEFTGEHRFLSNFASSPIRWANKEFPTGEHLYQARKTGRPEWTERVRLATTPGEAKRLGRKVPLLTNWEEIKFKVMAEVIEAKFMQNPDLSRRLVDTGTAFLIEGNTWHDQTWGDCGCERHSTTTGMNALGIILMHQRLEETVRHAQS